MKKTLLTALFASMTAICLPVASANEVTVTSPDGRLAVTLTDAESQATYAVAYDGITVITPSPLGIDTDLHALNGDLTLSSVDSSFVSDDYTLNRCKTSAVHYRANRLVATYTNSHKASFAVEFQVSDNNIAFRYVIPEERDRRCAVVLSEQTTFSFPEGTTTFLTPQSHAMIGWKRSKPSYEEEYRADAPLGARSGYGHGYTFPCLFKVNGQPATTSKKATKKAANKPIIVPAASSADAAPIWVLVSETGVDSHFCASRLGEPTADGRYTVAYPMMEENNGFGSTGAQVTLPCLTPWRTITVGDLRAITETTIAFDVVRPLYEPSIDYQFGRGSWSWMVWDDASINEKDLKAYIDLSAAMGWEYTLIDAWWDHNFTREQMEELIRYAHSKKVDVLLWYNSSGSWNDTEQSPVDIMSNAITRKEEMKWMKANGVKGIKVDFWGGDKQETMRLYEQVLSDANDYGIMCIFHGCTLPRGWERMYPNYVGSEAVLASENLKFSQHADDMEAFNACLHPFIRNTVGCMEFGGSALNKFYSRGNDRGNRRVTGDAFELATAVLFQNPIQNFGLAPNNLEDAPADAIDFMKKVPTTWDETRFIDGYPGRYVVMARRHGTRWYIAAINAQDQPQEVVIRNPLLKDAAYMLYSDDAGKQFFCRTQKTSRKGVIKLSLAKECGAVMVLDSSENMGSVFHNR